MAVTLTTRKLVRNKLIETRFSFDNPTNEDFELMQREMNEAANFHLEIDNDQYCPPDFAF